MNEIKTNNQNYKFKKKDFKPCSQKYAISAQCPMFILALCLQKL